MSGEFSLIDRYFGQRAGQAASAHVPIGIGDDCAAVRVPPGHLLMVSTDTFTQDVHFFTGTDPRAVGHKSLAVNLSDLAACGAQPLGCLMALSLPQVDDPWLSNFSQGFLDLARQADCPLIGGDTTRSAPGGGISITVTVLGQVPDDRGVSPAGSALGPLRRNGAQVGDDIWVSGPLGAAALGVALRQQPEAWPTVSVPQRQSAFECLDWPQPRLELARELRGVASACIDVSDGLAADLSHVLVASGRLGAVLHWQWLPFAGALDSLDGAARQRFALTGGDDYELCFTASPARRDIVIALAVRCGLDARMIGSVSARDGVWLQHPDGSECQIKTGAYEHF